MLITLHYKIPQIFFINENIREWQEVKPNGGIWKNGGILLAIVIIFWEIDRW